MRPDKHLWSQVELLTPGQILIGANLAWAGSGAGNKVLSLSTAEVIWFTWQKYSVEDVYHWTKYTVSSTYDGTLQRLQYQATLSPASKKASGGTYWLYFTYAFNQYAINPSTGQITLSSYASAQDSTNHTYTQKRDLSNVWVDDPSLCGEYRESAMCTTMWHYNSLTVNTSNVATATGCTQYRAKRIDSPGVNQGEVTSTNASQYPDNGISGSNWYIKGSTTQQAGSLLDTVKSTNASAYPDNGMLSGYWYIRVS